MSRARDRVRAVGHLLRLKHEIDLQALADAQREERDLHDRLAAMIDELKARASADDLSAANGNDAIWAARAVVTLRATAENLKHLQMVTAEKRSVAQLSFGRVDAFRGLSSEIK